MQFYRYSDSVQSTTTKNDVEATNRRACVFGHFHTMPMRTLEVRTRLVNSTQSEWWYQIKLVLQMVVLNSAVWYWICNGWTAPDLTPIDQSASGIIAEQVIILVMPCLKVQCGLISIKSHRHHMRRSRLGYVWLMVDSRLDRTLKQGVTNLSPALPCY